MSYRFYKKTFDIFFAYLLLILLSPIFFLIFFYLFFAIGRPVIFKDFRSGLNGNPFILYKFRTMSVKKNSEYNIEDDRKRTLSRTLFLRRTRLDEIPQLINIIRGDLSFVGPRPLLLEYNDLYSEKHKMRLSIIPGITGWSQINIDKLNNWREKFDYDCWYVKNASFLLDCKILILTMFFFFKSIINKKNNTNIFSEKYNGKN